AYLQLGIVFAESGETGEAMKSMEKAFELAPGNSSVVNNLGNLYAVWEYVDKVAGKDAAAAIWPEVKSYLSDDIHEHPCAWAGGEATHTIRYPGGAFPNLNARLNGYIGYARLARLVGDKEAEKLGTCLLARGLAVKHALACYHQFAIDAGGRAAMKDTFNLHVGATRRPETRLSGHFPRNFFTSAGRFRGTEFGVFNKEGTGLSSGRAMGCTAVGLPICSSSTSPRRSGSSCTTIAATPSGRSSDT
ncbi:hypothetical protein LCGC14_1967850, partial [marine sediment metagenome]